MSAEKRISDDENIKEILSSFISNIYESQVLSELLLRIGNFHVGSSNIFIAYVQPTIIIIYAFSLLLITCVMHRKRMIGVFQGIFLLSNFFEVLASLLETPLIIVFFFVADPSVPMPYPWCVIYYNLRSRVKTIGHLIASYLSLLLGINRICAVFVPFKMNVLFSKKRSTIYCCITVLGCILLSGGIGYTVPSVITKTWVDDIWENKKMEFYTACALDVLRYQGGVIYTLQMIEVIFLLIPPFCLVAMNIVLVRKLRRITYQQKQLHEAANQNEGTNRRIYAMNRVATWVFLSFIAVELPLFVLKLLAFYNTLHIYLYGAKEARIRLKYFNSEVYDIVFECLLPVNLILYAILSKKLRKAMKRFNPNSHTS